MRTILVSNRLVTTASLRDDGTFSFTRSVGGLATGLASIHRDEGALWVGWSGVPSDHISDAQREDLRRELRETYGCVPVDISAGELELFYSGFCNRTIWPLFHYFTTYVDYSESTWDAYRSINEQFRDALAEVASDGDIVWVHDYQLMLLPGLLKSLFPNSPIGFFLHIPFPSYEVFRTLPWRNEVLEGLLGADVIGFHTYDYARHFLSSVRRLLGYEPKLGNIVVNNRVASVDVFPMGIDYEKYRDSTEVAEVQEHIRAISAEVGDKRLILSVDRLDYTKGIPERLRGFKRLLDDRPEYRGKVTLLLVVSPSRTSVSEYHDLKKTIDEMIGEINGTYQRIGWTPIWYFYRTVPFDELTAMYHVADVLLVTAIRDGMNLIAKEYVAAKRDNGGVVVLSETAGSAREMSEALIVNPSDIHGIASVIATALEMPLDEQQRRNERIQGRLSRYDVRFWARDFFTKLSEIRDRQLAQYARKLTPERESDLVRDYAAAGSRLLLLDYDGTLRAFEKRPEDAGPDRGILRLLEELGSEKRNTVVVVSGRDRDVLDEWLGELPIGLAGGHGIWVREPGGEWSMLASVSAEWKETIRPVFERFQDRTPGSQLEEKRHSIAWHFRNAEPELAAVRLAELKDALMTMTANLDLSVLEGNQVLEIKPVAFDKGHAVQRWIAQANWDFILAIGDDHTDEFMFEAVAHRGTSVKVGVGFSAADYYVESVSDVHTLLSRLATGK